VKSGTIFDNLLISDDAEAAKKVNNKTFIVNGRLFFLTVSFVFRLVMNCGLPPAKPRRR